MDKPTITVERFEVTYPNPVATGSAELPSPRVFDERDAQRNPRLVRFHISVLNTPITSDGAKELSVSQFAHEAGVTPQAVRKMISEGKVEARKLGNQYVIKVDELYQYFERK